MSLRLVGALSALVLACALCIAPCDAFADSDESDSASAASVVSNALTKANITLDDDEYTVEISMEGGSGKASIESPTVLTVKDGNPYITIVWSSDKYDYMLLDGTKYLPVTTKPASRFVVPVPVFDEPYQMVGDTTAMGDSHEITYTFTVDSKTIERVVREQSSSDAASGSAAASSSATSVSSSSASAASVSSSQAASVSSQSSSDTKAHNEADDISMIITVASLVIAAVAVGLMAGILRGYRSRG